ncbi:MAG: phenylacetate-CoA oxygenase subunit PaaJ [Chitinophagaceae bacterium]|nr:MAG: phenylacetate-CoA oxygenase subunit PaaJ [Chitinophagaceae bacterium]
MQQQTIHIKQEEKKIWDLLANVSDPEVPVLSIIDLGIVRAVSIQQDAASGAMMVKLSITPTYSGCPAMDMIATNIRMELLAAGYQHIEIENVLSPAWTTEWMSAAGKTKLKAYGIAPPSDKQQVCNNDLFAPNEAIQCPQCNSYHTQRISEFGSTACKSLYQCLDCKEPFDYFKCH